MSRTQVPPVQDSLQGTSSMGPPVPCAMGPPVGHVLSAPSVEEWGTDYSASDDGARDLSGAPIKEPRTPNVNVLVPGIAGLILLPLTGAALRRKVEKEQEATLELFRL